MEVVLHPHNRQASDNDVVDETGFVEFLYCRGDFGLVAGVPGDEFANLYLRTGPIEPSGLRRT
jgi:hypothetical protein